ncbi:MAG: M3 family metallopeptidase [Candidatus Campbellbacteria bacterium]|nr:M3 family metallopeptidase [Candidatus Campbellbacteria bacterium]
MKNNTEWDLSAIYSSIDDPNIEKDVRKIEREYKKFADTYKKKNVSSVTVLEKALKDLEKLYTLPKPIAYLFLKKSVTTNDKRIDAKIAQLHQRIVSAHNSVLFFEIKLAQITKKQQKELLGSSSLKEYRYFLKKIFNASKHILNEKEEALLNSLSLPSEEMWIDLTERLVNNDEVEFENNKVPISEAMNRVAGLRTKKRRSLHSLIMKKLGEHSEVAEAEINAIYTKKKITDSKRGYRIPHQETLIDFETTDKELQLLREAVLENIKVSHDFYDVKRQLLGLKYLTYADRNAEIGGLKTTFSFDESVEILRDVFAKIHPRSLHIFDRMLSDGRIDVFPRRNKTAGGFCFGTTEFPTFVLLNHVNTFDSLLTLAHEMGHAIHTEMAKDARPLYQNYSTAVAEFASKFFENIVFEEVLKLVSKKEQKVLLHNRINQDISTIFRQMACFEFESSLHSEIRQNGYVAKDQIVEILNKKMRSYLGPSVRMSAEDGNFFVAWSHIRRYFYVYSYAYGGILSRVMYQNSIENPKVLEKMFKLLASGGSRSPKDLFKQAGINTEDKSTYKTGIESIKADIKKLKTL